MHLFYRLANRGLCRVSFLPVNCQWFSIDPETPLDPKMKIRSHFHAVKRRIRQSLEKEIAGVSLVSIQSGPNCCLTSESVCRTTDSRPSHSPMPEGRGSLGWQGDTTGGSRQTCIRNCQMMPNYFITVPHMSPKAVFSVRRLDCPYPLWLEHRVVLTETKQRRPDAKWEITVKLIT